MSYKPEATPLHKLPQIWKLTAVSYGLVVVVTIMAVLFYRKYGPDVEAQELQLEQKSARINVGNVWIPAYPNALLQTMNSSTQDGVTSGDLRFTSPDAPALLIAFYRAHLRAQFKVDYTKIENGGRMEAIANRGRLTATLIFTASGSGCETQVHTRSEGAQP